jgi:CubicO group peptidase (beta-lactamase class C family)
VVNSANDEIAADPGERFFYSNEGFRVVGNIIQEVSGVPFHEYIRENILNPLGMRRSTLIKHEFDADPDRMVAHWKRTDGTLQPTGFPYPDVSENPSFSWNAAAGGLMAPMTELTTYLAALMNGGVHNGKRLATEESIERMFTPHIKYTETYWGMSSYGYGWSVLPDFHGQKQLNHGGNLLVATAHLVMVPDLKLGVAMRTRAVHPSPQSLTESSPHLWGRTRMPTHTFNYARG